MQKPVGKQIEHQKKFAVQEQLQIEGCDWENQHYFQIKCGLAKAKPSKFPKFPEGKIVET